MRVPGSTRSLLAALLGLAALAGLVAAAFAVGRYPIAPGEVLAVLWSRLGGGEHGLAPTLEAVVINVRGPRILLALLVGAALASAGAAYQNLFRNPLVSPDILGVSAGAALGAVLGIFLSLDVWAIQGLAFFGGLAAVAFAYGVAASLRSHDQVLVLVLAGVVLGSLLGACIALLKYLADPYNQLPAITYWLLGSLAAADGDGVAAVWLPMLGGLVLLWLLRWRITVLSLGDEEAAALGVRARQLRALVVVASTLMTASAVSVSGIVGWVGLIVPHVARLLVGAEFSRLLPASLLLGGGFLLAVDTVARTVAPVEVPLGVLTAFLGTPLFLWLLATARRSWN